MRKWFLVLMVLSSFSCFAQAMGNGSSGGGNIFGDQLNPWFLQNTKSVNYCVEISPEFSELSKERVLTLISESFEFWKELFRNYSTAPSTLEDIQLGTQNFNLTECDASTDIKFQMGVLEPEQKKNIQYKQLIGLARRTSYDPKNLKAKGFIYIAPERGELRPSSPKLYSKPWSYKKNAGLRETLKHEIGHIFGFQDDHYEISSMMSAHHVEDITTKGGLDSINDIAYKASSPLSWNEMLEGTVRMSITVETPSNLQIFLGLNHDYNVHLISQKNKLSVWDNKNKKELGYIIYNKSSDNFEKLDSPVVTLYLTPEQKVFSGLSKDDYYNAHRLYNKTIHARLKDQTLMMSNGNSLKVFIQFGDQGMEIGTTFEDKTYFDVFYESGN
jgi:hypothetical protein